MLGDVMASLAGPKKLDAPTVYKRLFEAGLSDVSESLPPVMPVRGNMRTYMRASSLGRLCARRAGLQITNKLVLKDQTNPAREMALGFGTAFHSLLQDNLVVRSALPQMRGWWKASADSLCPGAMVANYEKSGLPVLYSYEEAVEITGTENLQYVEVSVANHEYFLTGHPDMIMDWGEDNLDLGIQPGLEVQEYKTIKPEQFDEVDPMMGGQPHPDYIRQLMAYMWLTGIPRGRLIYFKKGENDPAKAIVEWEVEQDESVVDEIKSILSAYWHVLEMAHVNGKVADFRPCHRFDRVPATYCPLRHECFGKNRRKEPSHRPMTEAEEAKWVEEVAQWDK